MQTVRRAVVASSAAVGGATALITKSAIDFESSFAGVRKTVDATEPQFKRLEQGFLALSRQIPINVNELNRLGEAAGQLGIARSGIVAFTETTAKLGVTTNLAATEAAEGLARLSNILQTPQEDFSRLGSTVVELGNKLAATEAELLEFGLRIAGAGKVARLTEADVLAIGGAMASVGIEAEAGGTATSKVLLSMADAAKTGGKQLKLFGEVAGTSAGEFRQAFEKDASKAFLSFVEGLGEIDEAGGNVFQTLKDLGLADQRLIRSFLSLSGAKDLLRRSLDLGTKAWRENTALTKEAEQRFRTTAAQIQLFKNNLNALAVQFGRAFLPGLQRALSGLTDFLQRVGEAKTVRARLNVIWEGVRDAAEGATNALGRAVAAIDFDAVWAEARGVADGLQRQLEEVDFGFIGKKIGDGIADAVKVAIPATKELAERISNAISAIDFEEIGKKMGPGLATALLTAFVTLLDPAFWIRNWDLALAVGATVFRARIVTFAGKLLAPLARLGGSIVLGIVGGIERLAPRLAFALLTVLTALPKIAARALSPLTRVVSGIFGRLGKLSRFVVTVLGIQAAINAVVGFARQVGNIFADLGSAISGALDRAWDAIVLRATRAALRIIEPFTHLPGFFGDKFRDAKEAMQNHLLGMEAAAAATAVNIRRSIDTIEDRRIQITIDTVVNAPGGPQRPEEGASRIGGIAGAAVTVAETGAKKIAETTAEAARKIGVAERAAADAIKKQRQATARAAKAAAVAAAKALEESREAFTALMDSLSLAFERAQATKALGDDLREARRQIAATQKQIGIEGETTDLLRQLFEVRQRGTDIQRQIREQAIERRQGRQFEALGLTSEGQQRVPGIDALRGRLTSLREQLKGTTLDTDKTRSQLQGIAKVLSGAFGKVSRDVRAAILAMFKEISGALDEGGKKGPLTKFQKRGIGDLTAGLGLSEEELKALRQRFSQLGSGGMAPGKGIGAFGFAFQPPTATTGRGAVRDEIHLYIDGQPVESRVTRRQQKKRGRSAPSRRGVRPGV